MTIAVYASGTQTCVIGTEHFLSSPNVVGQFRLMLDLVNLAAGDVLEVRVYKIVIAGGTLRAAWFFTFTGVQPAWAIAVIGEWISNALTDTNAVRFSIKQTFGTGHDVIWTVQQETNQADVTHWNGTAVATPATAGYPVVTHKVGTGTGEINLSSGNVPVQSGTGANQISLSSGAVLLQATQTGVTIPTVTNLTNAPTSGDFTNTMKTSLNAATPASVVGAVGSVTGNVSGNVTGSVGSVLGNVAGSVASVVGAVGSVTGNVAGNVVGSIGSLATQAKADVNTEVDTALVDINLDHLLKTAAVAGDVVDNTVIARMTSKSATPAFTSFSNVTDSLEAIADNAGGSAPTAAQNAAAVWDYQTSLMTTLGSIGAFVMAKLGLLVTVISTFMQNPTPSGRLTIYAGMDYYTADGTSPSLSSTSPLNLAGATITLITQGVVFPIVVTGSAGAYTFTVTPMPRADTATLAKNKSEYQIQAVLAVSGHHEVISTGIADVQEVLS